MIEISIDERKTASIREPSANHSWRVEKPGTLETLTDRDGTPVVSADLSRTATTSHLRCDRGPARSCADTVPAMNGSVQVPCPGTRDNMVYLAQEPMRAKWLSNMGECQIFVDFLDSGGSVLLEVPLQPGESSSGIEPPEGTSYVVVVCNKECEGAGGLEYELEPILIA
jgi:hypothetical protein